MWTGSRQLGVIMSALVLIGAQAAIGDTSAPAGQQQTPPAAPAAPAAPPGMPTMTKQEIEEYRNLLVLDVDAEPDQGLAPLKVHFTVKPDEEVTKPKYVWDFDDGGPQSHEASPTHTFKKPGQYRVRVHVTAANEKSGKD